MAGAIETLRQNVAAQSVISPVGTQIMDEARGSYRGEKVEASSISSQLEDAKEEIGMSVAHKADRRSLGQREVRQGRGANMEALARIADYYDKLPDMPKEDQLAALVEQMQHFSDFLDRGGSGAGATAEDVLRALQSFDSDPTHQYAALELARDVFAASGASEAFQALLDETSAIYQRGDLGRDTRAGFAVAEVANRAAQTLETDPAAVRETYRDLLRETRDMGTLFDAFRRFDVMKGMDEIVATFIEVAGRDLSLASPSSDPVFLHSLVTELAKLKKMQTAIDLSSQLTRSVDRLMQPGDKPKGTPVDVASRLLSFASREGPGLQDARQLLSRYDTSSPATQVAFANGLRAIHLDLPDEVMPSPQARLNQTNTLMRLLDELVTAEEAAYEGH